MELDRDLNLPLYLQLKEIIITRIQSGELAPGGIMETENGLCSRYGLSRYPVRQALGALVEEGYLKRVRGRGTFINDTLPNKSLSLNHKILGFIANSLVDGFNGQMFSGFERQARKRGYAVMASNSDWSADEELLCIDRMIKCGVKGICLFPSDDSKISQRLDLFRDKNIYFGVMDRNCGLQDIDYIGSDNYEGAYSAIRHMAMQGFTNTIFVSDLSNASSVNERLDGYLKAVDDMGLNAVAHIDIKRNMTGFPNLAYRFFVDRLKEEMTLIKENLPVGIFAVNDYCALQCIRFFEDRGFEIGRDIGIIGFDNIFDGEYAAISLTTVAQNGALIGHSAADIAIDKIEKKTSKVYNVIIPTQLVIRKTCGEVFSKGGY